MPASAAMEGVSNRAGFAIHLQQTRIGGVESGEHVHQGGFAGAVLAQQRVDLAPFKRESRAQQSRARSKAFLNSREPDSELAYFIEPFTLDTR